MKITKTFEIAVPKFGSAPLFVTLSTEAGVSWQAQSETTTRLQIVAAKIQEALNSEDK